MRSKEVYRRFFSEPPFHAESIMFSEHNNQIKCIRIVREYKKKFLFIPYTKTVEITRGCNTVNLRDIFSKHFREYLKEQTDKDWKKLKRSLKSLS